MENSRRGWYDVIIAFSQRLEYREVMIPLNQHLPGALPEIPM